MCVGLVGLEKLRRMSKSGAGARSELRRCWARWLNTKETEPGATEVGRTKMVELLRRTDRAYVVV
jgi:hypothetical protein